MNKHMFKSQKHYFKMEEVHLHACKKNNIPRKTKIFCNCGRKEQSLAPSVWSPERKSSRSSPGVGGSRCLAAPQGANEMGTKASRPGFAAAHPPRRRLPEAQKIRAGSIPIPALGRARGPGAAAWSRSRSSILDDVRDFWQRTGLGR